MIPANTKGDKRKRNPAYKKYERPLAEARRRGDFDEVKRMVRERRRLISVAPVDPDYRRLRYIRYADDFLLGFIGPKKDAEEIRDRLSEFLSTQLKLTLSVEKTFITHAVDDKARFLGYEIKVTRDGHLISENGKRATNGAVALLMPRSVVQRYQDRFCKKGKIIHRAELLADTDYTILQRYQAVLRGVYNYYCMAVNVCKRMSHVRWILEISLTKTLAHKFKCSVSQVYERYQVVGLDGKMLQVVIQRFDKEPLIATFGGFPLKRIPEGIGALDFVFTPVWSFPGGRRSEVVQRLLFGRCELCDEKDVPVEVHHIRKLADLDQPGRRPKAPWETMMSARKRKTLVVCRKCHDDIHAGRYDGSRL